MTLLKIVHLVERYDQLNFNACLFVFEDGEVYDFYRPYSHNRFFGYGLVKKTSNESTKNKINELYGINL